MSDAKGKIEGGGSRRHTVLCIKIICKQTSLASSGLLIRRTVIVDRRSERIGGEIGGCREKDSVHFPRKGSSSPRSPMALREDNSANEWSSNRRVRGTREGRPTVSCTDTDWRKRAD